MGTLSKNRALFFILVAGLAVRIFLIIFFRDHRPLFYDADSREYIALAENMRLGHGFSWDSAEPYYPNSFRTPVYPGFLFLSRFLFGSYTAALVIQSFLVILSACLLYLIGKEYFNRKIALWSAGIFLFVPFSLNVSVKFLTQTLFAFILILSVWSWTKFLKSQNKKYFLLTSFLLPILALTRPIAQYIPAVFIFSLACAAYLKQINLSLGRLFKLSGIMLGIFLAISLPWLVRNYKTFGVFEFSSIVPYQLYFYELPDTYAMAKGISYHEAGDFLKKEIDDYSNNYDFGRYMEFSSR
ncbi:MAG: glycosyltransferase family 39 protein, partial [Candidatus Yanofskybacteria bacterium]|nr:glycosyltransferase family 39 protein [Candidatus Yanofskybacteria bacterium]